VEIPRGRRDFQAEWKTGLSFSTERLFHNLFPPRAVAFTMPRP
jgi:hypothetical protein